MYNVHCVYMYMYSRYGRLTNRHVPCSSLSELLPPLSLPYHGNLGNKPQAIIHAQHIKKETRNEECKYLYVVCMHCLPPTGTRVYTQCDDVHTHTHTHARSTVVEYE